MVEIWKVYNKVSKYEISNLGNVRHAKTKRIRKPCDNGKGYLQIGYKINGKNYNFYIHRAVAETFIDKPSDCDVVNHIDLDKKNNNVNNLEWCTQLDNVKHARDNGHHSNNNKYNDNVYRDIITLLRTTKLTQRDIANIMNVGQCTVSNMNMKHVKRERVS
jgi:predicted XRE-type DNA-binding protein